MQKDNILVANTFDDMDAIVAMLSSGDLSTASMLHEVMNAAYACGQVHMANYMYDGLGSTMRLKVNKNGEVVEC